MNTSKANRTAKSAQNSLYAYPFPLGTNYVPCVLSSLQWAPQPNCEASVVIERLHSFPSEQLVFQTKESN